LHFLPTCSSRKSRKTPLAELAELSQVGVVADLRLPRVEKNGKIVLLPEVVRDHVARGSSAKGLKPLRRRAPSRLGV